MSSEAAMHEHCHNRGERPEKTILTIRSHSGLSGDMLVAGLASIALTLENIAPDSKQADDWLAILCKIILPELTGCLTIRPHLVTGISGWQARVDLPHSHEHRSLAEILELIEASELSEWVKQKSSSCFQLIAECEAAAHGINLANVHFHEVGALDSILDICASCELYERLGQPRLICGPLPLADGQIECIHGILPAPAPAVVRLLKGVVVAPFAGAVNAGELVTPTALALLHCLGVSFGSWPAFRVTETSLVYGQREFDAVANGVIFAFGKAGATCEILY